MGNEHPDSLFHPPCCAHWLPLPHGQSQPAATGQGRLVVQSPQISLWAVGWRGQRGRGGERI